MHKDEAGLKVGVVRPSTGVGHVATTWKAIVFREDIDKGNLANISALRVLGDG